MAALAKELHNINYVISTIDTKIETKKNEKHNLLIQSKVSWSWVADREATTVLYGLYISLDGRHKNSDDQW